MRLCLLGDTGSGKTITAIAILIEYMLKGFKVYSNIKLKGIFKGKYTYITNTGFTEKINPKEKNIVFLDEVGKTVYQSRTHNAIKLGDLVTQSRKSIGENSHLIFTTQLESQLNNVLMGLSDFLVYCNVILRYGEMYNVSGEKQSLPVIIELRIKIKQRDDEGVIGFKMIEPPYYLERNFEKIAKCYDTYEEVGQFGDGTYIKLMKKYKSYIGKEKKHKDLKTILHFKEHCNITESDRIARAIIMGLKEG